MKAIWREPLFHFLCLGLALFIGHGLWQKSVTRADYTIYVSAAELERQAAIFAGETRRAPSDADLKALLFAHVEEQALMREAERLGLGDDDTIIRRRLAQKMRFLVEDVNPPKLPDEATLKAWFDANKDDFITPETRAFSHIYLSPETHGTEIEAEAARMLAAVNTDAQMSKDWLKQGDPFIAKRDFQPANAMEIRRFFGAEFADALFALDATSELWQGPVASAFGLHIVRIDAVTSQSVPDFEAVQDEVGPAWQDDARRENNRARLKELIGHYKVVVGGSDADDVNP